MNDANLPDMFIILALVGTAVGAIGITTWLVMQVECDCESHETPLTTHEEFQWNQVVESFYNSPS